MTGTFIDTIIVWDAGDRLGFIWRAIVFGGRRGINHSCTTNYCGCRRLDRDRRYCVLRLHHFRLVLLRRKMLYLIYSVKSMCCCTVSFYIASVFIGCVASLDLVWLFADTFNGLMAVKLNCLVIAVDGDCERVT